MKNQNSKIDLSTFNGRHNLESCDPFKLTLLLIQSKISSDLPDGIKSLWIQGLQKGSVKLCVTIFSTDNSYKLSFLEIKNFRNIKLDMDNELKNNIINDYIQLIKTSICN